MAGSILDKERERAINEGTRPAAGRGERPLVLVVEDSPEDWEIYGKVLWYNGFDVVHATSGHEALELARKRVPDLMLVDLMLPGMDGLELCRRFRTESALTEVPVLMISARPKEDYRGRALDAGCLDFIEKPYSPVDLLHRVEALVGRPPPSGEGPEPDLSPRD